MSPEEKTIGIQKGIRRLADVTRQPAPAAFVLHNRAKKPILIKLHDFRAHVFLGEQRATGPRAAKKGDLKRDHFKSVLPRTVYYHD